MRGARNPTTVVSETLEKEEEKEEKSKVRIELWVCA